MHPSISAAQSESGSVTVTGIQSRITQYKSGIY
jgi:hypothetical protein